MGFHSFDRTLKELDDLARNAIGQAVDDDCTILFSGGVDSSVLAELTKANQRVKSCSTCVAGVLGSRDSSQFQTGKGVDHMLSFQPEAVRDSAQELIQSLEPFGLSRFEDCVAFFLIFRELRERKVSPAPVVLAANGPDELFCGYDRFRRILANGGYSAVQIEITRSLDMANKLADQTASIASGFGFKIRQPFLDREFVSYCRDEIPPEFKILGSDDMLRKRIWRSYARSLGLPDSIAFRSKKAMQYSMGIHKEISKLVKSGSLPLGDFFTPSIR
jgi:asparagine synthase (glutamine-hydrolysing)